MRRVVLLVVSVGLVLAAFPAAASADPSAGFSIRPGAPVAGQPVTFRADEDDCDDDTRCTWVGGGGLSGSGRRIRHTYASAGIYLVQLTVVEDDDRAQLTVLLLVKPAPTPAPAPAPAPPALAPAPTPPPTPQPTPATPPVRAPSAPTSTSAAPPPRVVPPAAPAPGPAAPVVGPAPAPAGSGDPAPGRIQLAQITPFPIVRIAGRLVGEATRLTTVSVRAPRSSRVVIRCAGAGCPFARRHYRVGRTLLRVRSLQGELLHAGARLDIRVAQSGRLGKRTVLRFRARRTPIRRDGCVGPNGVARRCA